MVIHSLVKHEFLWVPSDHDILAEFSGNSKKLIALEVVDSLTLRFLESIQPDDLAVKSKSSTLSLPVILEPFPSVGNSLWKLPTWQHVKWVAHAMAPVFALNLDSLNSIANAVKIYCLWLKSPESRPAGVSEDNLEEFVSFILIDMSELFESRRGNDTKSSQSIKRHIELCQHVIRTIVYDLIPNSPLFAEKASRSWDLITRLLLGITDNLLKNDKQNYLADELAELLLNSVFYLFLQGGSYSDELWKKFAFCFKLWCHRLKSVLVWGTVLVALNTQVTRALYATEPFDLHEVLFGMHSAHYHISTLAGEIFLRALQAFDKIVLTWLTAGEVSNWYRSEINRKIPDANTLFEIYGDLIFESANCENSTHDQGRAIAISIICRILAKYQYREHVSETFLSSCCACLKTSLSGDLLASATTLYYLEPLLVSPHSGILCLIIPALQAIRRLVPKSKTPKSPLQNIPIDALRMCCYRLMNLFYCYFSEHDCPVNLKLVDWNSFKSLDHSSSLDVFKCFSGSLENHSVIFKAHILDTLIGSILAEDDSNNTRFLLNSVSALLYTDHNDFPGLYPFLCTLYETILCKTPASWIFTPASLVDTQITIVHILEQWSRIRPLDPVQTQRLCIALVQLMISLHAKANLPLYFRLIASIYESVLSWLSVSGSLLQCISVFIPALVKFMNEPIPVKSSSKTTVTPSSPGSPTIYGLKNRKSLAERVFSLEFGNEDQRPDSLSPSLLKGIDEIFFEYTDSVLQRLICLLHQDQINYNHPVHLDSLFDDLIDGLNVKYYSLSSSILIGFSDSFIFVRNSIGKFVWRHEYKISNDSEIHMENSYTASDSVTLDHDRDCDCEGTACDPLILFYTPIVVTHTENVEECKDIILNESNWIKTFNSNQTIASKITPILSEVKTYLEKDNFILPSKSRLNIVHQQNPLPTGASEIISRLFLTNFGFLNSTTFSVISPIEVDAKDRISFISDLKKLDSISSREHISIPIHFISSNYRNTMDSSVSRSFETFVKGLGSFSRDEDGPIFTFSSSLKVNFPLEFNSSESGIKDHNSPISIIWSEDSETIENLPNSKLDSNNLIHLLILPISLNGSKGKFFRIRIILTRSLQAEYNSLQSLSNSFGPVMDGMVVKKSALCNLVSETSIFAHRFISQYIENSPNAVMKRQSMLKSIIFKNYKSNSYGSLINKLI